MNVRIAPSKACGRVRVPPSKSMAHRLLICAGLCDGESVIGGVSDCEDVQATLDCLRSMGADCVQNGDTVTIRGVDARSVRPSAPLNCRESGSTLRFLIPLLLLCGAPVTLSGYGRLMERPMTVYSEICRARGLQFTQNGAFLTVGGGLPSGHYRLPGNVSSQFVSGLLFALPLCHEDSLIELIPPVESRSYILMTLEAMARFGVLAEWEGDYCLRVRGGQRYRPFNGEVEGDYSNAAFLDALNVLGGSVQLEGLRSDSLQGDRCYKAHMEALSRGNAVISLGDCPDLGPVLFAVASAMHGGTFTSIARLRIKESDRVEVMRLELEKFGASVRVEADSLEILPSTLHAPSVPLNGHNDHRIVMSLSVLLTLFGGTILGAEAVAKSYPDFFDHLRSLGISVVEE